MELLVLLVADYANVAEGGKLNVMGIFSNIRASKFPARHPEMYLITKLSAGPAEYGTTRTLKVKLIDEDGKEEIVNWARQIEVGRQPGARRIEVNNILRLRDVVIPHPGTYQFSVLIDNDEKGTLPLFVIEAEQKES